MTTSVDAATIPIKSAVEFVINRSKWLHTEMVCTPDDGHPSQYYPSPT